MANEQNLLKGDDRHKFTLEEASKGGRASAKSKRDKKDLRKALEILLEKNFTDRSGKKLSGADALSVKLFEQAMAGSVKAFLAIRSTVGQDPVQRVMVSEVDQATIDEVERMVLNE